ncbi:MAG TPA: ATP-dependent metallopeptidase FtsH/Yme1/Tma family protein, partial [Nitrosospira sp.]|nr:ATP-dependent metallopeptidase FtsH/Yme1/Tma family protein [Nitrosospira sp.]
MTLSSTARQIIFWLLIVAGALLLYHLVNPSGKNSQPIDLASLTQKMDAQEIKQLTFKQNEAIAQDTRNQEYRIQLTSDQIRNTVFNKAQEKNPDGQPKVAKVEDDSGSSSYIWPMLITWAPLLFIIGIWVFMLRQMQSGGNKALSFGKSRAKLLNNQQKRVTFKDVAGVEEAKEELQEIIEFLKEPQKFQKLGGRIPKGVLMMGPPGT